MEIKLGEKVKDIVTGFVGVAVTRMEYLNGCVRYEIQAKMDKEGKVQTFDIDEEQLEKVDSGILKKKKVTNTGGSKDFNFRNATCTK